ncbi:aryl-sulfate sulfotransferase [Flavobacteriaceae bacterium]|nr:aryl-sulfate sulfotransferase [Flavobacteriaceae bacterium]
MKFKFLSVILILVLYGCDVDDPAPIINQPPVSLTENIEVYNPDLISNDYILAVENSSTTSYLLNKEGDKIFTWNFTNTTGNDLELLNDGSIIGLFKNENPSIDFGGFGGTAKIINNSGITIWEYTVSDNNSIAHHDVEILPNGNVLMIVWERIQNQIAVENGVDFENDIFIEKIIEINRSSNTVVWEWNSWNHIIQDKFESLPNYGDINENPNKININYTVDNPPGGNFFINGDIMHANGLDYDESNDLIYLSVNYYDEVWVIDHSTTLDESNSSSGGNYDKGGDLIYRFGNPNTYNSLGDKIFDKQHFPNLLEDGEVGEGNILIYANGLADQQSTIYELEMPTNFDLLPNSNNEPNIVWSFTDENLYANKLSGAIRLSNGNTLITESDYGFWEVTMDGEVVWKYKKDEQTDFFWRSYHYEPTSDAISNLGF